MMANKLLVKLIVGSEAVFFLALMMAYLFFWNATGFRQETLNFLDIRSTGIFTVFLLLSSLSFYFAQLNYKRSNMRSVRIWLIVTLVLGFLFLAGQAREYYTLIKEKMTVSRSEFGTGFYTLTGFHALHVLIGLLAIGILFGLFAAGDFKDNKSSVLGAVGIYWHFVDAVWIVVFILVYVLPYFV